NGCKIVQSSSAMDNLLCRESAKTCTMQFASSTSQNAAYISGVQIVWVHVRQLKQQLTAYSTEVTGPCQQEPYSRKLQLLAMISKFPGPLASFMHPVVALPGRKCLTLCEFKVFASCGN